MGELIDLAQYRAARSLASGTGGAAFFFNLADPFSYLAAERVERALGSVDWIPCALLGTEDDEHAEAEAEELARALRLPLVWPDLPELRFPRATRAAAFAAEVGRASQFALAAGRLAFCGGFDLDDDEILADAAGAAGLAPEECLVAADHLRFDEQPRATAAGLARRGVSALPAFRVARHWRSGPRALAEASALIHSVALGTPALRSS